MRHMCGRIRLVFGILTVVLLFTKSTGARSFWFDGDRHKTISLEMLRPDFVGSDATTTMTTAWYFSFRWPVFQNIILRGELPWAYYGHTGDTVKAESGWSIGNPYLGIEARQTDSPFYVEIGVRLPLISEDSECCQTIWSNETASNPEARRVGTFSDLSRMEAFAPDRLSVSVIMKSGMDQKSQRGFRLHGGPVYFLATNKSRWEDKSEFLLAYGALAWLNDGRAGIRIGYTGRTIVTAKQLPFSNEPSAHQVTFGARYRIGKIQPGFNFHIPFNNDMGDELEYVFGLNLAFQFD